MPPCISRIGILLSGLLASCAESDQVLKVNQFHLRDIATSETDSLMVTQEKESKFHGAVTAAERQKKLGSYYTLHWNLPEENSTEPVKLVFLYQQAATASFVKRMTQTFPAASRSGKTEFVVTDQDYAKGGRVLAWKATVLRGTREIHSKQSYLWR